MCLLTSESKKPSNLQNQRTYFQSHQWPMWPQFTLIACFLLPPVHQVLPPPGAHLLEPTVPEQPESGGDGDGPAGAAGTVQTGHSQQRLRREYRYRLARPVQSWTC